MNKDIAIKNGKLVELNMYCDCFLEQINFEDGLMQTNVYIVIKIISKSLMKN